jgi:hypothetical protein
MKIKVIIPASEKEIERCNDCPYKSNESEIMVCTHPSSNKNQYIKYIISHPECDTGFPQDCPLLKPNPNFELDKEIMAKIIENVNMQQILPKPPPNRLIRESEDHDTRMDNKCIGIMGKIFGHKFVTVETIEEFMPDLSKTSIVPWSEKDFQLPPNQNVIKCNIQEEAHDVVKAMKTTKTTFVHNICTRCGEIRK